MGDPLGGGVHYNIQNYFFAIKIYVELFNLCEKLSHAIEVYRD